MHLRHAHSHTAATTAAVHSFPTGDEGGITGPNEGGITVDECGAAVTAGHFNPLFVTPGLPQGQAQTLYEIGDFTGKFGPLAAAAATVEPGPRPRSPALKPRPKCSASPLLTAEQCGSRLHPSHPIRHRPSPLLCTPSHLRPQPPPATSLRSRS